MEKGMDTKVCRKCEVEKPLTEFYKTLRKGKDYYNPQCKKCRNACATAYHANNRERLNAQRKAHQDAHPELWKAANRRPRRRFGALLGNAKARDMEVTISFDDFAELISKPCFYCGGDLPDSGSGVDRIDSKIGYAQGNVRPCCTNCNLAKNDMTDSEFREWVCKIYNNWRTDAAARFCVCNN
jgi:hypothetical protein